MPVQRVAWSCQYGCRRRMVLDRKRMEQHEARCICNPDVRACRTCLCDLMDEDGNYCDKDLVPTGKRMALHCEGWHPKDDANDLVEVAPHA